MLRRLAWLAVLFSTVGPLAACKRPAPPLHETREFARGFQGCSPGAENCTYLKFHYPVFTKGPSGPGVQAVNRRIMDFLLAPTGEKRPGDIEAFARDFFADFQAYRGHFPKAPQVWTLERSVEVLAATPRILSLAMDETQFLGGAHPNSSRSLVSLDPAAGAPYKLGDLLKPGYAGKLDALGEQRFRAAREIPAGQSLEEAGFEFEGGGFRLNDNFAAGTEGLIFYFNPYEVAAYVYGPTEVTIDYASLQDLIKTDGPLRGLAR